MKIRILNENVHSQFGAFVRGDELSTPRYSEQFLNHLVRQVMCAEVIETKVINPVVENKQAAHQKKAPAKKKQKKIKKHS